MKNRMKTVILSSIITFTAALKVMATETEAGNEVMNVLTNLDSLIFAVLRIIGIIYTAIGITNLATSFSTHDGGQRLVGISTMAGGILVIFAKQILQFIGAY